MMDCVDAASQIMLCQQARYYDMAGPCECTRIESDCCSIFSEVACMLSNAGQTGGGEPVGGEEDAMHDRKLKISISQ